MKHKLTFGLLFMLAAATNLRSAETLSIGTFQGYPGSTVQVHVAIQPTTGVGSALLQINYDPAILRVISATNTPGTVGEKYIMGYGDDGQSVRIVMACDSGTCSQAGTLVDVSFEVNGGALPGMSSPLVIAQRKLGGETGADLANTCEISHSNGSLWVVFSSLVDSDNDGLNDYQEQMLNGSSDYLPGNGDTDISNPDTDGDGMLDGWEVAHGLNPLSNDAALDKDGDGLSNYQEWITGTNPDDKSSVFEISNAHAVPGTNSLVLGWNVVSGNLYSVYSTTNLMDQVWLTNVFRIPSDSDGLMSYTNQNIQARRFFRISTELP